MNRDAAIDPAKARTGRDLGRQLEILTAIDEGRPLTQRALAQRLGIALGLTNLYLRRLATRGLIKVRDFPRKPAAGRRLRYLLTPRGLSEKSRLTYEHMAYWASLYGRARRTLREGLAPLLGHGSKQVALCGRGEAAELAYLTLRELGLEPVGVFDATPGGTFLGYPVRDRRELRDRPPDVVIVATFDRPDALLAELESLGLSAETLVPLRPPARLSPARGNAR